MDLQRWRGGRVSASLTSSAMVAFPSLADGVTVNPSWGGAPGTDKIQRILNATAQAGLTCCVASIVIGGAALGIGKLMGSTQMGVRAGQLIFGGGGGALVITLATKIVTWLLKP